MSPENIQAQPMRTAQAEAMRFIRVFKINGKELRITWETSPGSARGKIGWN
jgi:hypothetical protein